MQSNNKLASGRAQTTSCLKFAASEAAACAWPVWTMRAESCVTVSSTWPAKKTIAVSMIANSSAKNTGATKANSTAAEPGRLRRNRRKALLTEAVEAADDGIGQSLGRDSNGYPPELPETDC